MKRFNMAALWKLPVVFVIENNKYSMGTSHARHAAGELVQARRALWHSRQKGRRHGCAQGARSRRRSIEHARSGKGPVILEMETYRYRGHSMSDPAKYRSKEEVEEWRGKHDPIETLRESDAEGKRFRRRRLQADRTRSQRHRQRRRRIRPNQPRTRSVRIVDGYFGGLIHDVCRSRA